MWKSKKFIILASVLAAVIVIGATAGVALAQGENNPPGPGKVLLARVAEILGIDEQKVVDAFNQARTELEAERPPRLTQDQLLDQLVENGKITQEQADQLKAWWAQKPANPKDNPEQFKEWLQSRPDIPMERPLRSFFGPRFHPGQPPTGEPAPAL